MIVAFEFEQKLYLRNGVSADWYGHPLLEIVKPKFARAEFLERLGLQPDEKYIGLFPGSRKQEIEKILPVMLETLNLLRDNDRNFKSIVGCASGIDDSFYRIHAGSRAIFTRSLTYDLMKHSELNLVASGTATLECAILGRPQVVLYKTSPITYLIGRSLVRIPYIGLVNVVAEKKIVPEFIQGNCRPRKVVAEIRRMLSDLSYMNSMLAELSGLRTKLGNPGASAKVARAALEMVGSPPRLTL
jgi:lipid-A-disaccharide synthase